MIYTLAEHGDSFEMAAWPVLAPEFPSYELFWQRHVVPLSNRPIDIQLKDPQSLAALGKDAEDVAMAQLHYTVFRHLLLAYDFRQRSIREFELFVVLSALVGAHDVAFELLQRATHRGVYDPWLETRPRGSKRRNSGQDAKRNSGQDAQRAWKEANDYPLQVIRDYRNKVVHGRLMPRVTKEKEMWIPSMDAVEKYCDWRTVTAPGAVEQIPAGDFVLSRELLDDAWHQTVRYFDDAWRRVLLK